KDGMTGATLQLKIRAIDAGANRLERLFADEREAMDKGVPAVADARVQKVLAELIGQHGPGRLRIGKQFHLDPMVRARQVGSPTADDALGTINVSIPRRHTDNYSRLLFSPPL